MILKEKSYSGKWLMENTVGRCWETIPFDTSDHPRNAALV